MLHLIYQYNFFLFIFLTIQLGHSATPKFLLAIISIAYPTCEVV